MMPFKGVSENEMDVVGDAATQTITFVATGNFQEEPLCGKAALIYGRIAWFLRKLMPLLFCAGYLVYLGFAINHNPRGAVFLCVVAPVVVFNCLNKATDSRVLKRLKSCLKKASKRCVLSRKASLWTRRILTVTCVLGLIVFLILDIWDHYVRWIPLAGMAVFLLITFMFSTHKTKVDYVPVVWGILMQFSLGLLILRWPTGYRGCQWLGQQVTLFLSYTNAGSTFVFGEKYTEHPIIFKVLPVVIFFSAMVSILYYLGVMQLIIRAIALLLQLTTRCTPIESFAAAAHIFIGQVESSVALRPFLYQMTNSEIHAIMTGGFATVAGAVIAAYVEFGVPAEHVISASFMSAPAALAIAKLSVPETKIPKIKSQKDINIPSGGEGNIVEALSVGAMMSLKPLAYCAVSLIAFLAAVDFVESIMSYIGGCVGYPQLSFELVCSYTFLPLAMAMGVPFEDAKNVGHLIGKKLMTTEMLAYADLGALINSGSIQTRSAVISAYILCGFGSFAGLGVNFGAMTSAAPSRRHDISRLCLRSMINGNIACFLTACVAGLLYQDVSLPIQLATLTFNSTMNVTGTSVLVDIANNLTTHLQ